MEPATSGQHVCDLADQSQRAKFRCLLLGSPSLRSCRPTSRQFCIGAVPSPRFSQAAILRQSLLFFRLHWRPVGVRAECGVAMTAKIAALESSSALSLCVHHRIHDMHRQLTTHGSYSVPGAWRRRQRLLNERRLLIQRRREASTVIAASTLVSPAISSAPRAASPGSQCV